MSSASNLITDIAAAVPAPSIAKSDTSSTRRPGAQRFRMLRQAAPPAPDGR